jgi:3-oxoadipyl-CoA thiolase
MKEVVIINAVRTPIGRYGGALKDVRPDDLAALCISELIRCTGIDSNAIEDVILGCANQAGEDNRNVARMAGLLAQLPVSVAGTTVNRLCGSSMDAVAQAARAIQTGCGDIYIAGGVESMTRAPFVMGKPNNAYPRGDIPLIDTTLGWRFVNDKLAKQYHPYSMGETAENVATKYNITRIAQDQFALASQTRYKNALASQAFNNEIVPVKIPQKKGDFTTFAEDEHPRPQTTLADLEKLKPAFREGGTVTAGNSSGINDGACAILLMSSEKAKALSLKPLARYVNSAVAGVDPAYMGIGPVPATKKVLERANLKISDIGLIELNEAFAAQVLACVNELKIDTNILNVNGGSIALGHPLGASGARIITTLVWEMQKRNTQYGLATMCIGVGQGIATILERLH